MFPSLIFKIIKRLKKSLVVKGFTFKIYLNYSVPFFSWFFVLFLNPAKESVFQGFTPGHFHQGFGVLLGPQSFYSLGQSPFILAI